MEGRISIKTKYGWISAFENNGKIFQIKFGKLKKQTKNKMLKKFRKDLLNFFDKKISNIKVPHKMKGTKIQKKIWADLKKIRFGKVKTYGELAKKYKMSPRHVGKICGQNRLLLIVPCHRVIRSDGNLGGFSARGGIKLKKKMLEFENN